MKMFKFLQVVWWLTVLATIIIQKLNLIYIGVVISAAVMVQARLYGKVYQVKKILTAEVIIFVVTHAFMFLLKDSELVNKIWLTLLVRTIFYISVLIDNQYVYIIKENKVIEYED